MRRLACASYQEGLAHLPTGHVVNRKAYAVNWRAEGSICYLIYKVGRLLEVGRLLRTKNVGDRSPFVPLTVAVQAHMMFHKLSHEEDSSETKQLTQVVVT